MARVCLRRGHWSCSLSDKEEGANIRGSGRTSLAKSTGKVTEMSLWWFGARKMPKSLGPGQERAAEGAGPDHEEPRSHGHE